MKKENPWVHTLMECAAHTYVCNETSMAVLIFKRIFEPFEKKKYRAHSSHCFMNFSKYMVGRFKHHFNP